MPSADDLLLQAAEKYWQDKVPTKLPAGTQPTPTGLPPRPPDPGPQYPANWDALNKTERWLYTKGLPWVEEQGWLDRLENFNDGWAGKALQFFDIAAEGVERTVGIIQQYKDAVNKGTTTELIEHFGSAWRAGSMAYDVMGAPGMAVTETGLITYDPLDINEDALTKARQMIIDGATTEEARAALYEDMGALAIRAQLNDAVGHIALDPANFILPKIAPITRLHKLRADTLFRSGRLGAEALEGALELEVKAFGALDDARKAGIPLNQSSDLLAKAMAASEDVARIQARGTFTPLQRFAIWATGGLPLSPETAAKWAAQGPRGWQKLLPWNWFKLTREARANEILVNVGIHAQALIKEGRSVDEVVGMFNRGVSGALGDEMGHIMMTPAGRGAQGFMKHSSTGINKLHAEWKLTVAERDMLHAAADILKTTPDELLGRLVKGEAETILRELTENTARVTDKSSFATQALADTIRSGSLTEESLEAVGKLLTDKPFNLDTFKYAAIQETWESAAKVAVTQLGIEEAGFFTRAAQSLKTIETLAFLRLNPAYAVRNFWNNEITMLARGNWAAWESTDHLMKMWDRIGVLHPRLTAGFGASGIAEPGFAAKKASTAIEEAFQKAQAVIGDAAKAEPNWVGKQLQKVSQAKFPGDMGDYARSAESWASIRAMSKGYMEAWGWFWRPRAPSAFDARLADLPQEVEAGILRAAKSAMNEAELDAIAVSDNFNVNIQAVLDDVAERTGISAEKIDDVFGHGFAQNLADELLPAIKSRNAEDVQTILRAARDRHQAHIANLLEESWENAYRGNLELMAVDGPNGVLRSWGETMGTEFGMWEAHLKSVQDEAAQIRLLPAEQRAPAWKAASARWDRGWQNYFKWYQKRMRGMVDGANRAGVPLPQRIIGAVDDRIAATKKFHTRKRSLFNSFYKKEFESIAEREQAWAGLVDELDQMYRKLARDQMRFSQIIDDSLAGSIAGEQAELFKIWRKRVRELRNDYMIEMREFYKISYDEAELAALGMSRGRYFDEVVHPMRAANIETIYEMERRGLLALSGDEEAANVFREMAERTAREGVPEEVIGLGFRRDPDQVQLLIEERGPPIPSGASGIHGAAIQSAANKIENITGGPIGDVGPFRIVELPEDVSAPFFRTSTGRVFSYEADSLADATRAYAAAIADELEAGGLNESAILMQKFADAAEEEVAAARLVESLDIGQPTQSFFPDAQRMIPEAQPFGLTANELWLRDGARIYDALEESAIKLIDEPPLKFSNLTDAQQAGIRSYIQNLKSEMASARNASMYMAEFKRDSALLNYSRRTNFDAFIGNIFPFAFWTTHSMWNWAVWSLEKPAVMATYLRLRRLFETSKGRKNLPRRMQGMGFGIKVPFLGRNEEWMGPLYFNPLRIGLPIEQFTYPFERMGQDAEDDRRRAARTLERQLEAGEITEEQYLNAVHTQSGNEWREAMNQVANNRDTWMDFSMYLVAPHAPAMWLYNSLRDRPFQPGPFLPATRTIKGITGLFGVNEGSGINIEASLRRELGLPEFDEFEDYRVDRMIANRMATGEITVDEGLRAMIDREGPVYEESQRRAGIEFGIRTAAGALGIPAMAYPPGEEVARNLADEWGEVYEKYRNGDVNPLIEFYDEHPEVKGRLGLFDSPEERTTRFLVDELNDRYFNSTSLHKKQIREALGEGFVTNFLNRETRAPMEIDPEVLGMWLKIVGGDPPGTLGSEALPIELAPPDVAQRAEAYYRTRSTYFPNYFEEQETYYKLDEGQPRKDYLQQTPSLKHYWDWKFDFLHRNPDIAPYVSESEITFPSLDALQEAEAAQPDFGLREWQQVLGMPMFQLTMDAVEGESVPLAVRESLTDTARLLGMNDYRDIIDRIDLLQTVP